MTAGTRDESGFTMIEIVVILLVMVIIGAALVMSDAYSTAVYDLSSEVEVIKTRLRYAQSRAMNSNSIWGMKFDGSPGTGSYYLFQIVSDSTGGRLEEKRPLPGEDRGNYPTDDPPDVSLPDGMGISSGTVYFDGWGRPYTEVPPSMESSTITVTVHTEAITIEKNTGFIP
ncbi:MAG TPA: type II secretion system protein [Deltaproteobacteria bacterium]|nr:type II secretion system protein [Deltaproteobacteria bacterium]